METQLSLHGKLSSLDVLLYEWLSEPDDQKFERKFAAYFSVAFPMLVKYLGQRPGTSIVDIEGTAQEAFVKFFDRVGPLRRQASSRLREALHTLAPAFAEDDVHVRRVELWTELAETFRLAAMTFRPSPHMMRSAAKAMIDEINGRIVPLQRRAVDLLEYVFSRMSGSPYQSEASGSREDHRITSRALEISSAVRSMFSDEELGPVPDPVVSFAEKAASATCDIPMVRVHTNSLLFEIAKNKYIDEQRKQRTRSHGDSSRPATSGSDGQLADLNKLDVNEESPMAPTEENPLAGDVDERGVMMVSEHPLQTAPVDLDDETDATRGPRAQGVNEHSAEDVFAARQIFEKFFEYLNAPVARASMMLKNARTSSEHELARRRLEREQIKYQQREAILLAVGEGDSQETIAKNLGLTRNQVKYAIEAAREELTRFLSGSDNDVLEGDDK